MHYGRLWFSIENFPFKNCMELVILKKISTTMTICFPGFVEHFWGPEPREHLFSLIDRLFPSRQAPRWKLGMYFYYHYGYKTCKQTTWLNEFLNHTMLASFEITCDHLNRTSWYRDIENFFPYKNIYAHIYFYICTYIFLYMYKCL